MNQIKIDLIKLSEANININEYLTLLKIEFLGNNSDIPFSPSDNFIESLEEKGFLEVDDQSIKLTSKYFKLFTQNSLEDEVTEVIEYFKEITGKSKVSSESPSNRKYVKDRLKQGYKKEDLKKVIEIKNDEWKNSFSMAKYIRLETLFNETKFQKYISEVQSINIIKDFKDNFKKI